MTHPFTSKQDEQMTDLRAQGLSMEKIARIIGVTKSRVTWRLAVLAKRGPCRPVAETKSEVASVSRPVPVIRISNDLSELREVAVSLPRIEWLEKRREPAPTPKWTRPESPVMRDSISYFGSVAASCVEN